MMYIKLVFSLCIFVNPQLANMEMEKFNLVESIYCCCFLLLFLHTRLNQSIEHYASIIELASFGNIHNIHYLNVRVAFDLFFLISSYDWKFCRAVVDHSLGKDLPSVSIESFECLPGRGIFATLSGVKVSNSYKKLLTFVYLCYSELSFILHDFIFQEKSLMFYEAYSSLGSYLSTYYLEDIAP